MLKNLPYARRGYVFEDPALQQYYEKMSWYIPNPNYRPDRKMLTEKELEWLEKQ